MYNRNIIARRLNSARLEYSYTIQLHFNINIFINQIVLKLPDESTVESY